MPESEQNRLDLELIREAAMGAGRIAMSFFQQSPQTWLKSGNSPVTEADLAVDRYLKDMLLAARPDYGWISEETVDERSSSPWQRLFVVDPIDGTRDFIGGGNVWCISIAVIENGRPVAGVLDCPAREEVMTALPGKGACLNGGIIRSRPQTRPFRVAAPGQYLKKLPREFQDAIEHAPHIASLAYRLAMVARGDLAGTFVRPNSHDWDLAAADLILSEAGGRVLTAAGEALTYGRHDAERGDYRHGALVASGASFMDDMLKVAAATTFG
ncbi:3'(2'),5'-bisphosphate nucleotidase CysQ [Phyllobacterium sp. 0TCS1.6C]|uniref:3'(2'),5'-bisphosphate nucleotidase CysQ n=1 Tax=unclassified Phyllobacterium TaxID=2638441 RepID=UPI002264F3BA|nr:MULTISPECIES: 3'(2'),5'-bisphosphate nucleotidase CysQ [unclassified Phyllobacterium]MCX8281174.1 3'(2'),5'-bisphosphate nucleotidase CysQ [Phyllobacterium sp. 0TCS1.6C]MCX8294539.1 3'(2'),5'-bisphosphate nucleotidase CysQ [Phyllobacterium sp. 0TCS1.6A]